MATPLHRRDAHRFEATVEGHAGRLDYTLHDDVMTIVHTEVDPALEGRGVAGALVKAALDHARDNGLKVEPVCAYAAAYMDRHPDSMSLRARGVAPKRRSTS
jgi:predicted GNAT family acetyltransferase